MSDQYYYENMHKESENFQIRQYVIGGNPHRFGWHSAIELMIALSGEITVYIDHNTYNLQEDDLLFIHSNCSHFYFPSTPDSLALITEIDPSLAEDWHIPIWKQSAAISSTGNPIAGQKAQALRKTAALILNCLKEEDSISHKAAKAYVAILCIDAYKSFGTTKYGSYAVQRESPIVKDAVRYIEMNFKEKLTLSDIALAAGCSKTYLSTLFKKHTDISIGDYLGRTRIRNAISMLSQKESTVMNIAMACGFPDSRSFTNCFKKYCGRTPQEYRKLFLLDQEIMAVGSRCVTFPDKRVEEKLESYRKEPHSEI